MLLVCSLEVVVKAPITPLCSVTNENHPLMLCVYTRSSINLSVPEPLCLTQTVTGVQGLRSEELLVFLTVASKIRVLSLVIKYTQYSLEAQCWKCWTS